MPDDAARDFSEAEALCEAEQYREALALLDVLDAAYPQARNIIYLRAVCLARTGQPKPAKALCRPVWRSSRTATPRPSTRSLV